MMSCFLLSGIQIAQRLALMLKMSAFLSFEESKRMNELASCSEFWFALSSVNNRVISWQRVKGYI